MKLSQVYALGTLSYAILTAGVAAGGGTYIGFALTMFVFFVMTAITGSKGE